MGVRMKHSPHEKGTNSEETAAMNTSLVTGLEVDENHHP